MRLALFILCFPCHVGRGDRDGPAACAFRCLLRSSIRYLIASIMPRPIKAHGGSIASRKGVSVWKTSMRRTFAQLPSRLSAPSNRVPLP